MNVKHALRGILLIVTFMSCSGSALALNVQRLRPYQPTSRIPGFVESTIKPVDTLTLGSLINYDHEPLEFSDNGGIRTGGIVDHLWTFDLTGAYSFYERFSLNIGIPIHAGRNLSDINGTAFEAPLSPGDVWVSGTFNLLKIDNGNALFGVGLLPFVTLPTGTESNFVGDNHITGGFMLSGDTQIGDHYFGLNLGLRMRNSETLSNLSVANELLYALGYHFLFLPEQDLSAYAQISGSSVIKNLWQNENQSPLEAMLGLDKGMLDDSLNLTLAGSVGLNGGYSAPEVRVITGITLNHLMPRTKEVVVEKVVEVTRVEKVERQLKELTIYYPTDGSQVDPFYDQKIAGIAKIIKTNPDMGPIYVIGHTDDVGSNTYNQRLSERRAQGARQSLLDLGLDPKQIVWLGCGETYPVVTNSSDANRALNRRTLFTFTKPSQIGEVPPAAAQPASSNQHRAQNDSYTEILKQTDTAQSPSAPSPDEVSEQATETVTESETVSEPVTAVPAQPVPSVSNAKRQSSTQTKKKSVYEEDMSEFEDELEPKH